MPDALTPIEARVAGAIDEPALLRDLAALVALRTCDGRESPAQRWVEGALRALGCHVDAWTIDLAAMSRHPSCSSEIARTEALGVVGWIGAADGPTLVLNGHVDVVPAGDETNWHYPPWEATVADGRVYGRGALDMKGGLCCALAAVRAIVEAGVGLRGRLMVQSVVAEEDGGLGTLATVVRGHVGDAAIVMEPTELAVAPAQAGALNFRITVAGRSAHGAMREEGVSAFDKFLPVHEALVALEARRHAMRHQPLYARYRLPNAITVGTVRAGNWASNVPESLVCEGRYGVAVGEQVDTARLELEHAVRAAAEGDTWLRDHPPVVEWWGGQFAPAAIPTDHPLVRTVADAFRATSGEPARIEGMTYGADMRLLVNEGGTPTVLFGPGDIRHAHRPDEFVPIADLRRVARTLAVTALRFCGVR
ncbi:MAG: ArgE/DapE family deacylase [Vicinamibacterales bacterium]